MTKFLTGLIYLITSCTPVMAADRIVEGTSLPGVSYEKNFVKNPEAEKNANNLTVSAAIATRTTTTPLQGVGSFSIDATASGQTVKFDTTTGDEYLKGQNCEAKFVFSGDASLYKAYVEQSSNKLTADLQLTNETNSRSVSINFPCGTTFTNLRPVIESTSASAAAIKVDKVYLGLATNIGNIAQAEVVAKFSRITTDQAIGAATETKIQYNGEEYDPFGWYDNVTNYRLTVQKSGKYLVHTTQSVGLVASEIFYNRVKKNGTVVCAAYNQTAASYMNIHYPGCYVDMVPGDYLEFFIQSAADTSYNLEQSSGVTVTRFPLTSEQVISANQTPWFIDARLNGANSSLGIVNVAAFTEITNAGWTLTPTTGSQPVGVMCSGTNAATTPTTSASTCAAGNESFGINFAIPYPGNYEVCTTGSMFYEVDSSEGIRNNFQLVETPTNAQTLTQSSSTFAHTGILAGTTSGNSMTPRQDFSLCANFYFSSAGIKGIRLMYDQNVNGTPNNSLFIATTTDKSPKFSVKQLSVPYPMPILVNSVTSNTSGQERIERATITNSGTPTVSTQSGSWISSITDGGVGIATLNIASGIFSAAPSCTVSQYGGGGTALCYVSTTVTSTSATIVCYNSSFALTDRDFMVMCMGPR